MKILKIISIVIGVVIIIVIVFFIGSIVEKEKTTTSDQQMGEFYSKNGFTVTYPRNWIIDDSQKDIPAEFIREPSGRAFVAVQTSNDERLKDSALRSQVFKEVEETFIQDTKYKVDSFEWRSQDDKIDGNSYMAAGSYIENNTTWRFREIGVFTATGTTFFLRGNVRAEFAKTYGSILDEIIFSFRPANLTIDAARMKIESLFEVKEYQRRLTEAGGKVEIEVEDGDDEWSVHVFEIVKNGDGTSHTATFAWYRVDKKNGTVEKD